MRKMVIAFALVLPLLFAALPLVGVAVWGDEAEPAAVMIPREPSPGTEPVGLDTSRPASASTHDPFVATFECEQSGDFVVVGS